jgi:RNA polymerase sigma-70 factor (ECF subfamily)
MRNLIRRILREEVEQTPSFETIYSTMWDKMLKQVCFKYTNDISKAEDYCQNAFLNVNRKLDRYDGSGSLEGWVRRVINNHVIDQIRKEKRGVQFSDEDISWERMDAEADEPYEETFNVDMIKKVVPELSPAYRKVFELYYLNGYDHKEIADALGISVGTSKSNLAKARKKVRELLSQKIKF